MSADHGLEGRPYVEMTVAATAQANPDAFTDLLTLSGGIDSFSFRPARLVMELLAKRLPEKLPVEPHDLFRALSTKDQRNTGGSGRFDAYFDLARPSAATAEVDAQELAELALSEKLSVDLAGLQDQIRAGRAAQDILDAAEAKLRELRERSAGTGSAPSNGAQAWTFTDFTDVLNGTHKPVMPTVGARHDGVGLFYPGRLNDVSGESEGGKTWFALIACIVEIDRGNHVIYLDFEDEAVGVVGRALLLGGEPAQLGKFFHYVRPEIAPGNGDIEQFVRQVNTVEPTLIVVDGVTEAMSMFGLELKENTDVAAFGRRLLRPLASTGAAVVTLDHVVKDRDSRGRYSLGGVHKLNGINGVKYVIEAVAPFGVGLTGRSRVRIAKDRPAQLRRHALPGGERMHWFADLVVESVSENEARGVLWEPYERPAEEVNQATPEELAREKETAEIEERKGAILTALQRAKKPLSKKDIEERVSGRSTVTRRALNELVDTGALLAESGPRGAVLHSIPSGELPLTGEAA